jgi:hypothetical protein
MDFLIQVNLPQIGCFFLIYWLLVYSSLPKHIARGVLIYHRDSENRIHRLFHGKDLYEDIYAIEAATATETETETEAEAEAEAEAEVAVAAETVEEPIKFESKYLNAFKHFSSDYFFNEDELLVKANKFTEFKTNWEAEQKKVYDNVHNLLIETQKILALGSVINEELKEALVKYFEIEEDYKEDASNIDFDELYIYVENDNQKFSTELELIEKVEWSPELETDIQEKALNHVLEWKLEGFINNYILESTPLGNVFMRYNNQKKSFEYFSNNTIPYRYLETIGRKYVMTFRCKALFVDLEDELKKASDKKELEKDQKDKTQDKGLRPTFKSYNNDLKMDKTMMRSAKPGLPPQIKVNLPNVSGPNNGENQLLKENANRYSWISRLTDFPMLKKVDRKTVDKNYAMSFADFKKSKENKT